MQNGRNGRLDRLSNSTNRLFHCWYCWKDLSPKTDATKVLGQKETRLCGLSMCPEPLPVSTILSNTELRAANENEDESVGFESAGRVCLRSAESLCRRGGERQRSRNITLSLKLYCQIAGHRVGADAHSVSCYRSLQCTCTYVHTYIFLILEARNLRWQMR